MPLLERLSVLFSIKTELVLSCCSFKRYLEDSKPCPLASRT